MIERQQNQRHNKPDVLFLLMGQSSGKGFTIASQGNGGGADHLSQDSTTEQCPRIPTQPSRKSLILFAAQENETSKFRPDFQRV
jgi:hypothetical protein